MTLCQSLVPDVSKKCSGFNKNGFEIGNGSNSSLRKSLTIQPATECYVLEDRGVLTGRQGCLDRKTGMF